MGSDEKSCCDDVKMMWMKFMTSSLLTLQHRSHVLARPIVTSLCSILERASHVYDKSVNNQNVSFSLGEMPVEYLVTCLKTLRIFIHTLLPSFNISGKIKWNMHHVTVNSSTRTISSMIQLQPFFNTISSSSGDKIHNPRKLLKAVNSKKSSKTNSDKSVSG